MTSLVWEHVRQCMPYIKFSVTVLTEILSTVTLYDKSKVIQFRVCNKLRAALFRLCCICLSLLPPLWVLFEDFDLRLRRIRAIFDSSLQVG